jgi:UDP-N-acetyl-D-glucosamine dehydrogenase
LDQPVAIIGLGYVGLPLAIAAAKSGYLVSGVDTNLSKVEDLNNGISVIEDIPDSEIKEAIRKNSFNAGVTLNKLSGNSVYIICVPTPLDKTRNPDMSCVEDAARSVAKVMKAGDLVILESTVMPGATRNYLLPILENESGLHRDSFYLAFSPERIDPKNEYWRLDNTPKIVAGLNPNSRKLAVKFYSKFIKNIVECNSLEIAEAAKLLENSFRLINISFINELSVFCNLIGIEIAEVVKAASSKPYGFMPFYPGIGIGGHCIPVDPVYLLARSTELGFPLRMIDLAIQINRQVPIFVIKRAEEKVGNLKNKEILVIGIAYKPNVSDIRESPVEALILELQKRGAKVSWHDDLVKEWHGTSSVPLSNGYDLAILATPHDYLDLTKLGSVQILDTRNSV